MKRILIVRTDRVGDVVMITPMIRELRKTYPDAFIATLTQPATGDILLHNPHLNARLTDDLRKETFWEVVRELRRHRFTDGLLVMPTERAAYQMFLAGIRNRVGVGRKLYEIITLMRSVSRNNYTPLRHEADYCMDLARKIGAEGDDIAPEIFVSDRERAEITDLLRRKGVLDTDLKILIHSGTRGSAPNWSEEKYAALISRIVGVYGDMGVKILLTAREMSHGFLSEIQAAAAGRVINLVDVLPTLRDLIKAVAVSDIVICSSTGPAHLGDALGKRCIVLYCHRPMSCSRHWGILNGRSVNLEVSAGYCRANCSADQNTCAFEDGISIDEVMDALDRLVPCEKKNQP